MLKLSNSERSAIDLMLDRAVLSAQLPTATAVQFDATSGIDTSSVHRLLKLLNTMQAVEPPSDLVLRTLSKIDQAVGENPSGPLVAESVVSQQAN